MNEGDKSALVAIIYQHVREEWEERLQAEVDRRLEAALAVIEGRHEEVVPEPAPITEEPEKPPRKPRSDRGVPRGPRTPRILPAEDVAEMSLEAAEVAGIVMTTDPPPRKNGCMISSCACEMTYVAQDGTCKQCGHSKGAHSDGLEG